MEADKYCRYKYHIINEKQTDIITKYSPIFVIEQGQQYHKPLNIYLHQNMNTGTFVTKCDKHLVPPIFDKHYRR